MARSTTSGAQGGADQRGHRFTTDCDTEVLVHLYEEYGERLVDRLRGMFAFAIWDAPKAAAAAGARSRRQEAPVRRAPRQQDLVRVGDDGAAPGSRSSSACQIREAIASYLAFQYVPHPISAFAGVEKLPPASTLVVTADGANQRRYWRLDYADSDLPARPRRSSPSGCAS